MALTEAGTALTEAYRRTQLAIRSATLRDLLVIWRSFSLDDIDRSWRPVVTGLMALIENRHRLTAQRAAAYYQAFRLAEGAPGNPVVRLAEFDPVKTRANLELVGPILTKKSIAVNRPRPLDTALVRVSGEVSRLTLNGGRETIRQSLAADREARGYRRITSGQPCPFCRLLAGRGAVYRAQTVDFTAHSHCACSAEPAF